MVKARGWGMHQKSLQRYKSKGVCVFVCSFFLCQIKELIRCFSLCTVEIHHFTIITQIYLFFCFLTAVFMKVM